MTTPSITPITSRSNPLLVRLRKLASEPAAYRKFGEIWIEGEHLCAAYLARGGHEAVSYTHLTLPTILRV